MMMTLAVAALVVVAFLGWNLYRRFGADRPESFSEGRRAASMLPPGAVHAAPPPPAIAPEVVSAT